MSHTGVYDVGWRRAARRKTASAPDTRQSLSERNGPKSALRSVALFRSQPRDERGQLERVDGLGDVRVETRLERQHAVFRARIGCERQRADLAALVRAEGSHLADQDVAVVAGHADVAEQDVGPPVSQGLQRSV